MQKQRRMFCSVAAISLAALLVPVSAQPDRRVRRIGFLALGGTDNTATWLPVFRQAMAQLGWVEERDYVIDARHANGVMRAGADLAAELVAAKPDLLLTTADTAARLLIQRTKTIPIVFTLTQDPVGNGNAESLQRPGRNATGLMSLAHDLSAKRLQLLKEAFPATSHVAVFFQPDNAGGVKEAEEIEAAGQRLAMRISRIEVRQAADIEPALKRSAALRAVSCDPGGAARPGGLSGA